MNFAYWQRVALFEKGTIGNAELQGKHTHLQLQLQICCESLQITTSEEERSLGGNEIFTGRDKEFYTSFCWSIESCSRMN